MAMCDETNLQSWAHEAVSRRQFGALTGAAALAAGAAAPLRAAGMLPERTVTFPTQDGTADGFFVHPAQGRHPAVILWPDIAGLREVKRATARELAAQGYAVLVMNPYYRDVAGEQFADFADFISEGGFQKVGPWRGKLDATAIMNDARATTAWLDDQDAVDPARGIGTQGYCMGGPFTVWSAAAVPARIKAAASFHGGGLVRPDNPLSPHALLGQVAAGLLIAIAKDDDAKAPSDKHTFGEAAQAAGRIATITVYNGNHGWMVPDSPAYAATEASRGEAALLAHYQTQL
jgi:carboxymethylenebutenolidase